MRISSASSLWDPDNNHIKPRESYRNSQHNCIYSSSMFQYSLFSMNSPVIYLLSDPGLQFQISRKCSVKFHLHVRLHRYKGCGSNRRGWTRNKDHSQADHNDSLPERSSRLYLKGPNYRWLLYQSQQSISILMDLSRFPH